MILSDNRQEKIFLTDSLNKTIEYLIEFTLRSEDFNDDYEVSIIFVDNEEIKEINKNFRNIDKATDILSFPILEYPEGKVYKEVYANRKLEDECYYDDKIILGDIAISLEKAMEQSIEYEHSFEREVSYLIVHSILHLLGYDHMEENQKAIMRKREEQILTGFNISR